MTYESPLFSESDRQPSQDLMLRMGWTGRAPAPDGTQSARGLVRRRSTAMQTASAHLTRRFAAAVPPQNSLRLTAAAAPAA